MNNEAIPLQICSLIYKVSPKIDPREIANRINQIGKTGAVVPDDFKPEVNGGLAFMAFHESCKWNCKDGELVPQTVAFKNDKPYDPNIYAEEVQQSWFCSNAKEIVDSGKVELIVTDMMSRGNSPSDRLRIFHSTLYALVQMTKPIGMVFKNSSQVIDSQMYLAGLKDDLLLAPGAINVRFYNISNGSSGDMIMDTRGLTEIGLPDLQCHFHDLDPQLVAGKLFSLAQYIIKNGLVIENGHTISGIDLDEKWKCQHEDSILKPNRVVIDINPGNKFSSGTRKMA